MSLTPSARPSRLHLYLPRAAAERALQQGEFRLQPAGSNDPGAILPFAKAKAAPPFLLLSWSAVWNDSLFDAVPGADACLVVRDTEQLGERIHRAVARLLPDWAGIDAAVSYGTPSPLGAVFSRERGEAAKKEWLFAWRPRTPVMAVQPITVEVGSLAAIAEVRARGAA